jgi:hypothetical protein
MAFNPSIDVNSWKSIQWSNDPKKLDSQLTELMLKLSTWAQSANRQLVILQSGGGGGGGGGIPEAPLTGQIYGRQSAAWTALRNVHQWFYGAGPPPTPIAGAISGDFYLNTTNGDIWVVN